MSMDESEVPGMASAVTEIPSSTGTGSRKRGRKSLAPAGEPPRKRRKRRTGTRGGWSKGLKIGPRPAIDPGAEFNELYKQATNAFIDDQDTEKARDLILQAIAINPEIYSAHALLSEIFFARDEDEKAIAALFSGAHSIPADPEVWQQAADACLQRSTGPRELALQQASYCYARIISSDNMNMDARFQRAAVNRELANYSKAMKDLDTILEHMPRNSSVLRQMAEICIETRDLDRAKLLYENTLSYYRQNGFEGEESFTWADILVYAQILALEEPPDLAVANSLKVLKQLSRWLLGRQDDDYWDLYSDDDREWDSEDHPRRVLVAQFIPGRHSQDVYGSGLPLEIRARLGMLRLKQGPASLDEALAHFGWLEPEARDEAANVYEYPDLFLEVAQCLHEAKEHNQALRYYEALRDTNAYSHTEFWLGIAANFYICDNKLQAIECYEEAKAGDDNCVEARTQLSKLYADLGDKAKAMENAREAVRIADNATRKTEKRKYERKEQRLARKEAETALEQAFKLPGPHVSGEAVERIESRLWKKSKSKRKMRQEERERAQVNRQVEDVQSRPKRDVSVDIGDDAGADTEIEPDEATEIQQSRCTEGVIQVRVANEHDAGSQAASKKERKRKERQLPQPRAKRMTKEEKESHRTENILRLYTNLVNSTDAMREGDKVARNAWIDCAESLVTDFRSNRVFYPAERHTTFTGFSREARDAYSRRNWEKQKELSLENGQDVDQDFPIPSVESTIPTEYREIAFSDWLDVFLEYALLLAQTPESGGRHRCYTVINAALDCAVWYHDPQARLHIYTTYFTCALALRDETTLFNVVLRWFIRTFQFCTDTYRLFAAMNLFYPHPNHKAGKDGQMNNAVFRNGPSQKYMFRQVMNLDLNLPTDYNPEGYGPVPDFMRNTGEQIAKEDGDENNLFASLDEQVTTPKEMDVVLLTIYAHILYAGGSFPNALSYLFRARSLDPKNPVVLLSIALSYMHEMLKRQNENRHMYVLQGWAFFEEYADARRAWARGRVEVGMETLLEREIEFNRARCWQMLGMSDLAIRSYEKMLSLSEPSGSTGKDVHADYTMDAAYAVQTMYALSGNPQMARAITEKYLVV